MRPTLGIDIGGTRLRAAVVAADGTVLSRAEGVTPARDTGQAVVDEVARIARLALAATDQTPFAIGISAPGPLDTAQGLALTSPTIDGFRNFPLRDRVAEALGLPAFLDHDGQAAAYGEWLHGAGRGTQNMVYVTVSTGIGGGAIVDGRLQQGRMGMATHFGHMTVQPDGPVCNCGNPGCWEALAAGPALSLAAQAAGYVDGAAAFAAAGFGEVRAMQVIEGQARWLGLGMANLAHIYSPEVIVLGGGVMAGLDQMRADIAEEYTRRAMPPFRMIPFVPAVLQDNAGLIGAAALGRAQALNRA